MSSGEMTQCWSDEAQKLFKNIGEQFKQAFVDNEVRCLHFIFQLMLNSSPFCEIFDFYLQRTQFDAEVFLSLFEQYLSEPSTIDWNKMKPLSLKFQKDYESLPQCSGKEERDEIVKHLSVVKLNGGLGTTMGCDGPKSLIELRTGLTFLDFAIGHVQVSFQSHQRTNQKHPTGFSERYPAGSYSFYIRTI